MSSPLIIILYGITIRRATIVLTYVKQYIGKNYRVLESSDVVYIGTDFPKKIKGSVDTVRTKGGNEKAKN